MKKKKKKKKTGRWTTIDIYPGNVYHLIGRKGGGKSLFAAKIAADNTQYFPGGIYDNQVMNYHAARAHITMKDLSLYRFEWSMIISDEVQDNGLYSRNWQKNLRDYKDAENLLMPQINLCRHYKNAMIFVSHGANEMDSAIRDNNLIDRVYFCRHAIFPLSRWFCVAERMVKADWYDEHGVPHTSARFPTLKEKLFRKGYIIFISKKKYGPLYDTDAKDPRIEALPAWSAEAAASYQSAPKRGRGRPKKNPDPV